MDPHRFLVALRQRLVRALVIEGVARLLAILVLVGIAAVLADWQWRLPGVVRLGLLLGVIGITVALAWVRLVRPLRRDLGPQALASFTERRVPALGGRLLTAVEGIPLGAADEAALAATLAGIDLRQLVPARRTPKQVAVAASAVLFVVACLVLVPETVGDGLRRLVLPLGSSEWRVHTRLRISLQHEVVPADGALVVAISRQHPDAGFSAPVVVSWRGGRVDETRQLGGLTGSSWSTSIAAPPGIYEVIVTSGDAPPASVTGRIVARPTLGSIQALITPPAYTGLPAQRAATLAGSIIPGTTIEFGAAFTTEPGRQITTASARFGSDEIPLHEADGRWVGKFTPRVAGTLSLVAADQDKIQLAGDARFPLTITPDRAPVVSLSGPQPREAVTVRAVLAVMVAASDDFGLDTLALHGFSSRGDKVPPKESGAPGAVLERFSGVGGQTAVTRPASVEVGRHAAEGELLVLTGRGKDRNDVTGPGVGDSEPLVLKVVPEEVLRQEFDRLLGEARDRVVQSREDLAAAATAAAGGERPRRLRAAGQAAGKADELLAQVLRRWDANRFAPEAILPGRKAHGVLTDTAVPQLAATAGGEGAPAETARQAADQALAEAERLLGSILQEGDLTRLLTSLIARQTALNAESRAFARAFLTKPLDAAGKALQANLATRQQDLAQQVQEVEHRLLAKDGSAWTRAQDIVRKQAPGDHLRQAGQDLATPDRRGKAIDAQQSSLAALQQLLDALRGGDAAKDLAAEVGKLAAEQEQLAKELERGTPPGALAQRQKDLAERTQAAMREAQTKNSDGAKLLGGANSAQQSAEKGMRSGDAGAAARDANAAAGLLREAQKKLDGEGPKKPEEEKKKSDKVDVLALLKELRTLQAALVTEATIVDQALGAKHDLPPDFASARQVQAMARSQGDLRLRLNEEAIKPLEANPIAKLALERVEGAMQAAETHLATPLLGTKGVRLTRTALAELTRLIDVAENLPKSEGKPGGEGGGGGGGKQPPFPPQAELALLAAMQAELAQRTAAGSPADLAGTQARLQHLVEGLTRTVRPDTRPAILLERTRRAMTSAAFQLTHQDRGALTRHEQQAAEAALRRLLAEASGGGGGGGGGNKPPPPRPGDGGQPPPSGGDGQGNPGSSAAGSIGPKTAGKDGATALPVQVSKTDGELLQLPPAIRDQLLQAREQQFTPGQMQVYQRYLELLEEGK